MIPTVLFFTAFFLIIPAVIIVLCQRLALLEKAGVVVLSFAFGIACSALMGAANYSDMEGLQAIQISISEVAIALALPLLVFSINVKSAFSMAGDTLKAMGLALFSIVTVSIVGAVLFSSQINDIWQVAGMSVGAYTGGGPNMAAVKSAIGGDDSVFVTMVTYDLVFSAVYLIFVMSIGQRLFGLFLRKYESQEVQDDIDYGDMEHMTDEGAAGYKNLIAKNRIGETFLALFCSVCVVALAAIVGELVPEGIKSTVMIVSITSLGLVCSFIPSIRKLTNSFQAGMYLVLVFCFTTGSMINIDTVMNIDIGLASYTVFILGGSLILQAVLCKFFDIDTDTFLISSSAAVMSVPFVPVIAGALKNRELLLPGFSVAILGYVIGNYLGILVASVTKWLLL